MHWQKKHTSPHGSGAVFAFCDGTGKHVVKWYGRQAEATHRACEATVHPSTFMRRVVELELIRVSGFIQKRRKFSATKATQARTLKKQMEVDDIKIEIQTGGESVRYLGQMITFQQQETTEIKNRVRAAWATFLKYRQELTSKNYMLKHRLRLFDAAITPTICHAAGTWTPTKEHERMTQSPQRKMIRLIIQTKRRYKTIVKQKAKTNKDNEEKDTNDLSSTGDESEDGQNSISHQDQDSDAPFEIDTDEEIDTTEIEQEDWVDYF